MTPEQYRALSTWDDALTVGQEVMVCWTNSHRAFAIRGTVTKINAKSLLAAIAHEIRDVHGRLLYETGRAIKAPRFMTQGWSSNNCVCETPAKETP
jgi:hypothetical protein